MSNITQSATLYNAGDRLKEVVLYSLQPADKNGNWLARWEVDAPAESFFELPLELLAPNLPDTRIPVSFPLDFVRKHGHRGIVMINPKLATAADDDTPFAATEEEAQEKAHRLWIQHLQRVAQAHIDACADLRAAGAAPRAASHFTRRALKLLGMTDPGERIFTDANEVDGVSLKPSPSAQTAKEIDALKEMVLQMKKQNDMLMARIQAGENASKDAIYDEAIKEAVPSEKPKSNKK